jgi:hypothetical protein
MVCFVRLLGGGGFVIQIIDARLAERHALGVVASDWKRTPAFALLRDLFEHVAHRLGSGIPRDPFVRSAGMFEKNLGHCLACPEKLAALLGDSFSVLHPPLKTAANVRDVGGDVIGRLFNEEITRRLGFRKAREDVTGALSVGFGRHKFDTLRSM